MKGLTLSVLRCQFSGGRRAFFMAFTQAHSVCLGLQRETIYQQLSLPQPLSVAPHAPRCDKKVNVKLWIQVMPCCQTTGCFLHSCGSPSDPWQTGSCWSKQAELLFSHSLGCSAVLGRQRRVVTAREWHLHQQLGKG